MWLKVLTGARAGKLARISGDAFVIGARRGCDLVLRDPAVASRHAAFRALPSGGYAVEDLGSDSGTFVSGVRIRAPVALEGDERLCVGETFLELVPAPRARRRRRTPLVAAAAGAVLAAAGTTAALLAPHTGSDLPTATLAAPKPRAAPQASASVEPAAETVERVAETGEADRAEPVVLRDDFSNPASGWEVFDAGVASSAYLDGALTLRVVDSAWYATATSPGRFAAPAVRVTVENPERTTRAGFGVICAYRSERNFLAAGVGTDGTFAILRNRAGALDVLTPGGVWARSDEIPVGASRYRLTAVCRDGTLRLSVDGRLVARARIPRTDGRVGFFAAGLAEFRFDDVVVADRA